MQGGCSLLFMGNADYMFVSKLKAVKVAIKSWKSDAIDKERRKVDDLKKKVNELEMIAEHRQLSVAELDERKQLKNNIKDLEFVSNLDLKQKSRIKWMIDVDENTFYFHGIINSNRNKYRINGLSIDGRWEINPDPLKEEIFNFFSKKFHEVMPSRPKLISPLFKKLSMEESRGLEAQFSVDEIKSAVWACGGDKAPGPDGFTFKILKQHWEIIKDDVVRLVRFYEANGSMSPGCNSSFISLFPKLNDPLSLRDYRPISLIGCSYKIISKLLALRLKKVVDKVVSNDQSAYIEG